VQAIPSWRAAMVGILPAGSLPGVGDVPMLPART
jgi:hypothetical protein